MSPTNAGLDEKQLRHSLGPQPGDRDRGVAFSNCSNNNAEMSAMVGGGGT